MKSDKYKGFTNLEKNKKGVTIIRKKQKDMVEITTTEEVRK